jgi:hypothetical protein
MVWQVTHLAGTSMLVSIRAWQALLQMVRTFIWH